MILILKGEKDDVLKLFNLLEEMKIEESVDNLELVKSYLKLVDIDLH